MDAAAARVKTGERRARAAGAGHCGIVPVSPP